MTLKEAIKKIKKAIPNLNFKASFNSGNSTKPYGAQNLIELKKAIDEISDIDFLRPQTSVLTKSSLFDSLGDNFTFSQSESTLITEGVNQLKAGLQLLIQYYDTLHEPEANETIINIKLPEINSFDDLTKASNDFKKVIEMPLIDSNTQGKVNILSVEQGSIWFVITVTTTAAVHLIAGICWAAAVIRKKWAEAAVVEEHVKTLGLKNEVMETLVEAQRIQINNLVTAEAEAIMAKSYDLKDPEVLSRLKLSLNTMADLIDRGAKIIPAPENNKLEVPFPDYDNLGLISSAIKQIKGGGEA